MNLTIITDAPLSDRAKSDIENRIDRILEAQDQELETVEWEEKP